MAEEKPFSCPSRLRRSLARSRETCFTRPNRRACSQAMFYSLHVQCMQIYRKLVFHMQIVQKIWQKSNLCAALPKREFKENYGIFRFGQLGALQTYIKVTMSCFRNCRRSEKPTASLKVGEKRKVKRNYNTGCWPSSQMRCVRLRENTALFWRKNSQHWDDLTRAIRAIPEALWSHR